MHKRKRIGNANIDSEDIERRYRDGIWCRKMCQANYEKQEISEGIKLPKARKNQNAQIKGNLQILGNIESGHHQTSGDGKKWKRIPRENKKTSRHQTT